VRGTDGRRGIAELRDGYADLVIIDAFVGARVPAGFTWTAPNSLCPRSAPTASFTGKSLIRSQGLPCRERVTRELIWTGPGPLLSASADTGHRIAAASKAIEASE